MSENAHVESAPQRSKKVRAILAGGVVLGIGAAVTLAAWNDSEFAEGIFTTGQFNLEGSTDGPGGTFDDHNVDEDDAVAVLDFDAGNVVPGQTVYAPFDVRLDAETTVDGTIAAADGVTLTSSGGNVDFLGYSLHQTEDCTADGTSGSTPIAGAGTLSSGSVSLDETISLASNGAGTEGDTVSFCFAVTADENDLVEGIDTTATWQFLAVSEDA